MARPIEERKMNDIRSSGQGHNSVAMSDRLKKPPLTGIIARPRIRQKRRAGLERMPLKSSGMLEVIEPSALMMHISIEVLGRHS
jgi:hypothetical protein